MIKEATDLELMEVAPPFDKSANIMEREAHITDTYMHVQLTTEIIARTRDAISMASHRLFTGGL